ncbi:MAG: OsmC family peroxiredoxin [Candidatus Marinimicrobia bacterium]|nr:OsmC family peroxiredoxin [Candidatus Neomarinimicrobiota bacterium]MCF7903550.1 OsmC family peroxiredoxin [Candidatus Neomarinimicrobiota bacterium]
MAITRKASAVWRGGLKDGNGEVSTSTGVLNNTPYNFNMRFADEPGTNPEELIAAAHAACFAMALSGQLDNADLKAESLSVTAKVKMEKTDDGMTVTESNLELVARIPGASEDAFNTAAANAKAGCPISRLLNCEINLESRLES